MIELDNRTSFEVNLEKLIEIANFLTLKDIELIITDNEEIQKLNRDYRGVDKATDVISFPFEETPSGSLAGIIVISIDKVKEAAKEFGHSLDEELTLLFIHGLLHLLGYDHEIDDGQMRAKEEEIIKKFNLPKSLIVRNS